MSRVYIVGPPPGAPGGIGIMMQHLEASLAPDSCITFIDSGTTSRKVATFIAASLKCLKLSGNQEQNLFHFNLASRGSSLRKFILAFIVRIRGGKYILHLHGAQYREFYEASPPLVRLCIRYLFRRASRVLVLGDAWRRFVVSSLGVEDGRVGVLRNAVPGPEFVPYRENDAASMIFIGRSSQRKGLNELLEAVSQLVTDRGWRMVLAGDAQDAQTERALQANALVEYSGWLDQQQLAHRLEEANIFVLPSHAEGLPLALLDAMAWGLAPIVTNVGSIADVIIDGVNGIYVEVGNSESLRLAIEKLVEDNDLRNFIARNARSTWERELNASGYAKRLNAEHQLVLEEGMYAND